MKRNIFWFIVMTFFFFSCSKEVEKEKTIERGSIVETVYLGSFSKSLVVLAVSPALSELALAAINKYDVDYYRVIYNTIDPFGEPTIASGLVVLPKNPEGTSPLLSYQHGTMLNKYHVASYKRGEWEVCVLLGMKGYVVSAPDYLGLGDGSNLHPYLHAESEATATVDMMRATRYLCDDIGYALNEQVFLMGYSQGGHATLATLKKIEEQHHDEFNVTACSAMAGPYDLSGTSLDYVMRDTEFVAPGYLPFLIFAYNDLYHLYPDLNQVFIPPYYDELKTYFNDSPSYDLDDVNDLWPSPKIPNNILKPEIINSIKENPDDPLRKAMEKNNLYDWAPESPLTLCHCDSDAHVPFKNSEMAYNHFIQNGSANVRLVKPFRKGTHITCTVPSYIYTLLWFNSLRE